MASGPTAARDWRLDRALEACLCAPKLSGAELQIVVGHLTVRALVHRGLMGLLRHSYVFIEECYDRRARLWPSVVEELWWFRALMPLGVANFFSSWSPVAFATDACLTGYAVCQAELGVDEVRQAGCEDERWRFFRGEGERLAPRAAALDTAGVFDEILSVRPETDGALPGSIELNPAFPEVPEEMLREDRWHQLWNLQYHYKEPIHVLELRSILGAVKHVSRDCQFHGSRCLILNDNMGVVLAVSKGRCSNYSMLRLLRRIAAVTLATNIRICVRWIPSERNAADKGSRQWEKDGPAQRTDLQEARAKDREGLQQGGGECGCAVPRRARPWRGVGKGAGLRRQ